MGLPTQGFYDNLVKIVVMLTCKAGFLEDVRHLIFNGVNFPLSVKSLGVLSDPSLSLERQVETVTKSVFSQLLIAWRLVPFLDSADLDLLIPCWSHAVITLKLD